MKTSKKYYEKSNFKEFVSNITYDDLLKMNESDFTEWAKNLRKEVTHQWDTTDTPPVIGKNEDGIVVKDDMTVPVQVNPSKRKSPWRRVQWDSIMISAMRDCRPWQRVKKARLGSRL